MPAKRPLPFGIWPSPVSAELAARGSRRFGMVQANGEAIYWSEARPEEQGRQVIVRCGPDGRPVDVLPKPYSARSRVHEYGGGEFLVSGATIFFVNDKDQQVYELAPPAAPQRITRAAGMRFADFAHDASRARLIAVTETHAPKGTAAAHDLPRNALAAIALTGKRGQVTEIAGTHDFYASPRLSADGTNVGIPCLGSAGHAVGQRRALRVGRARQRCAGPAQAHCRRRWQRGVPAGMGAGRSTFTSPGTRRDGAISIDGPAMKAVRVHGSIGAELWRPQWVFGSRCYALHPDGRFAAVSSAAWSAASGHRQAHWRTHRCHWRGEGESGAHRRSLGYWQWFRRAGEFAACSAGRDEPCTWRPATDCGTDVGPHRARLHQPRQGGRFQECEAADSLRHSLSAGEPAPSRAEGSFAARARHGARRAHQHDGREPEAACAILYEPRLCRARRQLCGQHRLRPCLPRAPRRAMGHRRRRRLRCRCPPSRQGGTRRYQQDRHRRRQRGRLHDA